MRIGSLWTLNNVMRSPASKDVDTGGGRNGHHVRQSFPDLQAGVSASADAAGDGGDTGSI
jgi:hypothetical protein